ncbi:AAA family ATPase, partial [uncultured Brachyspira sp.]
MFTYVKLKNYKSLVDFEVDLTSSKNNPKKMIIIYGENGAGKTNFINSFFTLFETLNTKIHYDKINKLINENLDNKNNLDIIKDIFKSTDYI